MTIHKEKQMLAMKDRQILRYVISRISRDCWEWIVYKAGEPIEVGYSQNVKNARYGARRAMECANQIFA